MPRRRGGRTGKRRRRGHFCWCCQGVVPNEKFSGKGHATHLCKKCQRLPTEEREFRRAQKNLHRCATWEGLIPRKRRRQFESFLVHPNSIIRSIAHEMRAGDERVRRWMRDNYEIEDPEAFTGDANLDFDLASTTQVEIPACAS
jgi:hypothetical protein